MNTQIHVACIFLFSCSSALLNAAERLSKPPYRVQILFTEQGASIDPHTVAPAHEALTVRLLDDPIFRNKVGDLSKYIAESKQRSDVLTNEYNARLEAHKNSLAAAKRERALHALARELAWNVRT